MPYTTEQLIVNAYYLSQIVSRDLGIVSGSQLQDGLFRLNGILAMKAVDTGHVPYFKPIEFTGVIGQQEYYIPSLIEAQSLTFNIDTVRYSVRKTSREDYFSTSRAENINALPFIWHMEREKDGSTIYVYPNPQEAYPFELWGKQALSSTVLNQDLSTIYDDFYLEYLLYLLAKELCSYFSVIPPGSVMERINQMEQIVRDVSPLDFTMKKAQYFSRSGGYSYGDANLGQGWRPSGY